MCLRTRGHLAAKLIPAEVELTKIAELAEGARQAPLECVATQVEHLEQRECRERVWEPPLDCGRGTHRHTCQHTRRDTNAAVVAQDRQQRGGAA